EKRIVSLQT
ncbi:hypothetical protein CP061683_0918B, partial [Chlamydia psittaci 06-1683]